MSRARTDQACLEAQLRAQVEQKLNAELAGERRDTERCPPPTESLEQVQELNAVQESLTRAAARAFAESMATSSIWFGEGSTIRCPICDSAPGVRCRWDGVTKDHAHWLRSHHEGLAKTPTAPDCAPAATDAPVDDDTVPREPGCQCHWEVGDSPCRVHGENEEDEEPPRPVCACGQEILRCDLIYCGDCSQTYERGDAGAAVRTASLDKRIAETKSDDATECAWSTPTSEGEGWR